MITLNKPMQKICQNAMPFHRENDIGFRRRKKPVIPGLPDYFTWVKSDKESSPVVGKIPHSWV